MIRIAVLDDHPAVLAGLERLAEKAPDLFPVATVETQEALWRELDRCTPDVVVVDCDLARGDGLAVCQRPKRRAPAVRRRLLRPVGGEGGEPLAAEQLPEACVRDAGIRDPRTAAEIPRARSTSRRSTSVSTRDTKKLATDAIGSSRATRSSRPSRKAVATAV